jgi:hypothetical protein
MYCYKVAPPWSWLVVALHLLCQFDAVKFQPRSIPSNINMPQAELVQFKFHISIRDLEDAVSASSGLRSEIEQVIMADTAAPKLAGGRVSRFSQRPRAGASPILQPGVSRGLTTSYYVVIRGSTVFIRSITNKSLIRVTGYTPENGYLNIRWFNNTA